MTPASPWIARFVALIEKQSTVLDVACGGGRHGRLFLPDAASVCFVDKDISKVRDLGALDNVRLEERDLEGPQGWPYAPASFDAIIVTNYLYRPTLPALCDSVREGGYLLYETFAQGNERFGRPKNPEFLLKPNELLDLVAGTFQVVAFEQGIDGEKVVQRICARRSADWSALT